MKLNLLITSELRPIPEDVKVLENYGRVDVRMSDGVFHKGDHCIVEASQESIIDWLSKFEGFLKGVGHPQMQSFEIVHIPPPK